MKKPEPFTLESAVENQKAKLAKEEEERQAAKDKLPEHTLEYEVISHKGLETETHFKIQGKITLDKEYLFEATNNHHMPIVYGCFDMETISAAKSIMAHEINKFNFMNDKEANAADYSHINDAEFTLVFWRLTDDNGHVTYHAYTDEYVLIWDNKKFKVPARKMIKYALDKDPRNYRKLEQQKNTKKLSDKFIAVCKELYAADFTPDNDPQPTKAVITVTKEESRGPVVYNGPINDIFTKANSILDNAEDEDLTEGCDDLDF